MGQYWMLTVVGPRGEKRATIGRQPDLSQVVSEPFFSWTSGTPFEERIPILLEFQLDPNAGDYVTDFFPPSIPLMSTRMLNALASAGVNNIDAYDALLLDKTGKPLDESFKAINILGRIACADLEASDCVVDEPNNPIGVDFERLVIDENRTHGELFFRLHEAPNGIVVHDSVKQKLEPLGLRGVVFVEPEEWSG